MDPAQVRQSMGLSIKEMAHIMGVHRQTWTKWERGERRPDNAAVRLMELLCWLHEHHPRILAQGESILIKFSKPRQSRIHQAAQEARREEKMPSQ